MNWELDRSLEVRHMLSGFDLFSRLDDGDMDALLACASLQSTDAGTLLFQKGDAGDCLYGVLEGRVKIFVLSGTGREVILNIMGPGDVFGEIALLDGSPRTASAETACPARLLRIEKAAFWNLLAKRPAATQMIMAVLCERLRWVSEAYEGAIFHDLPSRLAQKILLLVESFGIAEATGFRVTFNISQADLAQMLGVSREKINQQIHLWKERGILTMNRGRLLVHKPDDLAQIAREER
jgi:CRP-like cAMP-binding protein